MTGQRAEECDRDKIVNKDYSFPKEERRANLEDQKLKRKFKLNALGRFHATISGA